MCCQKLCSCQVVAGVRAPFFSAESVLSLFNSHVNMCSVVDLCGLYHLDSAKTDTVSLRKVSAAKFSEIFKFKFSGRMKTYKKFRQYQCAVFKKEIFLLCAYEEMYLHLKLLIENFSYFVR